MKHKFLLAILFCTLLTIVKAQDDHFSQSYASPLLLNPATAGNYDGQYRLNLAYKDQWRSISKTYKTFFASADFVLLKKKKRGSFLGAGIVFNRDKAGAAKLGTTSAGIALAYTVKLNRVNFIAVGLQSSFVQRSITTSGLKWDNQFNGNSYDPALSTGEPDYSEKINYVDFDGGILWTYMPDVKNKISAGISVKHLNKPSQSFLKSNIDNRDPKLLIHVNGQLKIEDKNIFIVPIAYFSIQGNLKELNAGGMIRYGLGLDSKYTGVNKSSFLSLGALYRTGDALIILLNLEYKSMFTCGISYDINISKLSNASNGKGGLEFCLVYSGFFDQNKK